MMTQIRQASLVLVGVLAGVLLSLNFSAVAQREAARFPLPVDELRAFAEVFGAIKSSYVEPVEDKKLITEAISGMLTGLDPHSAYLDQDAFRELQVGTQGEFGGLGIEVGMEEGFVKVVSPIEDTPAFRAGLKPGDFIIKIDDTSVKGMNLNDAVKRMRGKPRTTIRLTILRKGEANPFEVTLTRDVIRVQSVKSKLIEPGYGWIRVSQFQEHTGENLVKNLEGLYKNGPLMGLILALRFLNRCGRAAGPQARDAARHADFRQGLGADDTAAGQQHRDQADHRALLHAERPLDPGEGHRPQYRDRGSHLADHGAATRGGSGKAPHQRTGKGRQVRQGAAHRRQGIDRGRGQAAGSARVRLGQGLPVPAGAEAAEGSAARYGAERDARDPEELIK